MSPPPRRDWFQSGEQEGALGFFGIGLIPWATPRPFVARLIVESRPPYFLPGPTNEESRQYHLRNKFKSRPAARRCIEKENLKRHLTASKPVDYRHREELFQTKPYGPSARHGLEVTDARTDLSTASKCSPFGPSAPASIPACCDCGVSLLIPVF